MATRNATATLVRARSRAAAMVPFVLHEARRNPNMAVGFAILLLVCAMALLAPFISRYDPVAIKAIDRLRAPSAAHWFGTDHVGRDVYARTIYGSRISLGVGLAVAAVTSIAGMALGIFTGYYRGVDNVVMRLMDAFMAFPALILAMALIALLGSTVQNVIIAVAVVETPRMVRVVRGVVLSLREREFVSAARAIGARPFRIMRVHILPNTMAPVIVQSTFIFAGAILTEASLSFLGAGSPPYIPSWGNIMGQGRSYLQMAVWVTFYPGLFLMLTVLAINFVGDGLRDRLDPRLRRTM